MYSFRMSFCTVPESLLQVRALFPRHGHVKRQQNCRRRVDGHRRGNALERNSLEERFHVFERINRHAHFADFALRQRGDRNRFRFAWADRTPRKVRPVPGSADSGSVVGFRGGAEAGVLPHGPQPAAIHGGINSARVRKFAGIAELRILVIPVCECDSDHRVDRAQVRKDSGLAGIRVGAVA